MILKPMGTPGKAPKHVRAWTQQEDALLAELYPSHTAPELTKHFQRTESAIRSRIRLLLSQGVIHTKQPPLNTKELNTLIKNRHTKTVRELASELGRSPSTVELNLRKRGYRFRKYGELHHKTRYSDHLVELVTELRDEKGMTFSEIRKHIRDTVGISLKRWVPARLYSRYTAADCVLCELLPD
ncbi:DNA-binding protein [Escherichia coli]|uniref:DNA-binding protein n=1 Tax=Escherichia coli TaxID=562 RepID=UPI00237FCFEB|nr:DNA-binding protein [Escherichia coli]